MTTYKLPERFGGEEVEVLDGPIPQGMTLVRAAGGALFAFDRGLLQRVEPPHRVNAVVFDNDGGAWYRAPKGWIYLGNPTTTLEIDPFDDPQFTDWRTVESYGVIAAIPNPAASIKELPWELSEDRQVDVGVHEGRVYAWAGDPVMHSGEPLTADEARAFAAALLRAADEVTS